MVALWRFVGLTYAERHPQRVTAMVHGGVTTTRRAEIDLLYRGVAPLFPAQWARFRTGVPPAERAGDLVSAYHRLLQDPDPAMHMQAAQEWHGPGGPMAWRLGDRL